MAFTFFLFLPFSLPSSSAGGRFKSVVAHGRKRANKEYKINNLFTNNRRPFFKGMKELAEKEWVERRNE